MGSRILLADDSITIQKVVNLTFADEGIEVFAVSNGDLAERRLNEVKPDLVLADIFMPGKNGYELCEVIKQNPLFRNVPVVLLVGAFEPFDQAEARRVQADAHLTKPFESRTLVETVRRLISESGRATTGPIAPLPSPGEGREEIHQAEVMAPRVPTPEAPKLDLAAMIVDQNAPVATSSRNTGELSSSPTDERPPVFDIGVIDMPAYKDYKDADAILSGAGGQFDPMELAEMGEPTHMEMKSPAGDDQQDMMLDFDKVETLEPSAPLGTVSLDTETSFEMDADPAGLSEAVESFRQDHLDTRTLEAPASNTGWQTITTTAPLNGHAANFSTHSETAFAPSERSAETVRATMLAVDDPLGDVLHDESVSAGAISFGHDLLDIELTAAAATEAPTVEDTHFDLIDTVEAPADSGHTSAAVDDRIEEQFELRDTEGALEVDQSDADSAGPPAHAHADFVEDNDILDWTSPETGDYKTSHLDSSTAPVDSPETQLDALMPIDVAESPTDSGIMNVHIGESQPGAVIMNIDTADLKTEPSADAGAEEADKEAIFESARTWPEEEAHFTAIDIEAFPVQESAAPSQSNRTETGLSASSGALGHPAPGTDAPASNAASPKQPANGVMSTDALSSAMIEEIVRRVVAAMSESVVREVAWEVVPDCVERVIDQLTRESLSRRA